MFHSTQIRGNICVNLPPEIIPCHIWHYIYWRCPFSHSVVSDSLWNHGLQHTRLPCPSPTPRAFSNSCLSSWQCHPTISSSVVPFTSCFQSFPTSGSFPVTQFFISGGKSIGASEQGKHQSFQWVLRLTSLGLTSFRIDWFVLLAVQGTLKSLLQHQSSKASVLWRSAYWRYQRTSNILGTWTC